MNSLKRDKKGRLVSGIVSGVIGLVILVVIGFVVISTVLDANLLSGSENSSAYGLSGNLTSGINEVAIKIPTILLIAAVVLLFGVLVFLVAASRRMGVGGGGTL